MKTILRISFDSITQETFELQDPPVIPVEGDILDFTWADFIADKNELEKLELFSEDNIWIANIACKTYSKTHAVVYVVLFEEESYISLRADSTLLRN